MREPNRYASLKAELEAARAAPDERGAEGPPAPPTSPPAEPAYDEQVEARLATYDVEQLPRVEAGQITATDYAHDRLQLDQDLAREARGLPTTTEFQPTLDGPTLSAEQHRQAEISPTPREESGRADAIAGQVSRGREVSERDQARIDQLLDHSSSDERDMRLEQEIGSGPSRGRSR